MPYSFQGSGAFFVKSSPSLSNIRPLSISAWVFASTRGGAESAGNSGRLFVKGSSSNEGPDFYLNVSGGPNGDIVFLHGTTGGGTSVQREGTSGNISPGRWIHVCATWSGNLVAAGIKLYAGGTETPIYSASINGNSTLTDDTSLSIFIGNEPTYTRAVSGWIEELAWWNAILTPNEVRQLALGRIKGLPFQIQPSKLVGYFPMNDSPDGLITTTLVTTIIDATSGSYIGTATNGTGGNAPKSIASQISAL